MKNTLFSPFNKGELQEIGQINEINYCLSELYYGLKQGECTDIIQTVKYKGDNKGQYGYFISSWAGQLYTLLKRLRIESLIDLGSGPGVLLKTITSWDSSIRVRGYEIEDKFVQDAHKINVNVVKKDILKLIQEDIKSFKALYFWEPLSDPKLAERFVLNLDKIIPENTYIFYVCAGDIGRFLNENAERIKYINSLGNIRIYKS